MKILNIKIKYVFFLLIVMFFISFQFNIMAKPLYITVPRTYSSTEDVWINMVFNQKKPVEVRLLKPENIKSFISEKKQDMRRAKMPITAITNPAYYMSKGLNDLAFPGRYFLNSLNKNLRDSIRPRIPKYNESEINAHALSFGLDKKSKKIISIPKGLLLVRSEWVNANIRGSVFSDQIEKNYESTINDAENSDLADGESENIVSLVEEPQEGFDSYEFEWSEHKERRLSLGKLEKGIYIVQIVQGDVEAQAPIVITDLSLQIKQSDDVIIARVSGRDLKPKSKVNIQLYASSDLSLKTNESGEARFEKISDPRVLILAEKDNDIAIVDTDFYSNYSVIPDVFIYTDRPIYRPGDEVFFRGVARKPNGFFSTVAVPSVKNIKIQLTLAGELNMETTATVDEFGSFCGSFVLPENVKPQVLNITATFEKYNYQAEARVQEYNKPTFYIEFTNSSSSIVPGSNLTAKFRVRRYAGNIPVKGAYEVFLYRTVLDSPSWIDSEGLGAKGSNITYGSISTTEDTLSIPIREYSSMEERYSSSDYEFDSLNPWATAPTLSATGEGSITIAVPTLKDDDLSYPFKYTLTLRVKDEQGAISNMSKVFLLSEREVLGNISPVPNVLNQNDTINIAIRALNLDMQARPKTDGKIIFSKEDSTGNISILKEENFQTGSDGVYRINAPTNEKGKIGVKVLLFDKNKRFWVGEQQYIVVGKGVEPVIKTEVLLVNSLTPTVEPDSEAVLVAFLPNGWGESKTNAGNLWLTFSSSKIFETKSIPFSGNTFSYKFKVDSKYGSTVYVNIAYPSSTGRWEDKTAAFRVISNKKLLYVDIIPEKKEAHPMGTQSISLHVTDSNKKGVSSSISISVVDKAIYSVQKEFRPKILDFFYPLLRNNIDTFYSSDFAGYGFGDVIARSLLSQKPFDFASIKPPSKKRNANEKDTAYWNSSIETDSNGMAKIDFKMPSNSTTWVITAVAVDKTGRFGENLSEFISKSDANIFVSVPSFLRNGDVAFGNIRVSNLSKSPISTKILTSTSGELKKDQKENILTIPSKGEESFSVEIASLKSDKKITKANVTSEMFLEKESISDIRSIKILPATHSEKYVKYFLPKEQNDQVAFELPIASSIVESEVNLLPSTLALTISMLTDLAEYPYGCLEQLIATTIPNIAIYEVLKKSSFKKLSSAEKILFEKVQLNARDGIKKILTLTSKDGGFGWFSSGEIKPNYELTLIALNALSYAVNADLISSENNSIQKSISWISKQTPNGIDSEITKNYVLSRFDNYSYEPKARELISKIIKLKETLQTKASSNSVQTDSLSYSSALAILLAKNVSILNEAKVKTNIKTLSSFIPMESALKNAGFNANASLDDNFFMNYPIGTRGLRAIFNHALFIANKDIVKARENYIRNLSSAKNLSTFDMSTIILNSLWLIEEDIKTLKNSPKPEISLPSGKLLELASDGQSFRANVPFDTSNLSVKSFDGVLKWSIKVDVPYESAKSRDSSLHIERNYYAIRSNGKELLKNGSSISLGEDVFVEIKISKPSNSKEKASNYYVIEDPIPSGFTALEEDKEYAGAPYNLPLKNNTISKRIFDTENTIIFIERKSKWMPTADTFGYIIRSSFQGSFVAPPVFVRDMYNDDIFAQTPSFNISVSKSIKK